LDVIILAVLMLIALIWEAKKEQIFNPEINDFNDNIIE